NGNLYYPRTLFAIPSRGLPIELALSYNSSWHNVATNFGNGWQLSYNMFYLRLENGDIVIVWEDGRADQFTKDGGIFHAPVDTYNTLSEYAPGKYRLRTKEG